MGCAAMVNNFLGSVTLLVVVLCVDISRGGLFHSGGSFGRSYGNNQGGYEDQEFARFDAGPSLPAVPGISMGLGPSQLHSLLSSVSAMPVDKIPAISEHIYASPSKVVISGYDGPMKKVHGTIRSFHKVRTVDNGGQSVGSTGHHSFNQYFGRMASDYGSSGGYEDFNFPPGW